MKSRDGYKFIIQVSVFPNVMFCWKLARSHCGGCSFMYFQFVVPFLLSAGKCWKIYHIIPLAEPRLHGSIPEVQYIFCAICGANVLNTVLWAFPIILALLTKRSSFAAHYINRTPAALTFYISQEPLVYYRKLHLWVPDQSTVCSLRYRYKLSCT